ncbi:retrovirus-related pol polyprotein from transposon TNT 1-94 [Tanacetum coccineum]
MVGHYEHALGEKDNSKHNTYLEEDGTARDQELEQDHFNPSSHNPTPSKSNFASTSKESSSTPSQNNLIQLRKSVRGKILRRRFPIEGDEALACEEWNNAMEEELRSIEKNQTWEVHDLPKGKTPIGLKWIFKTKYFADGSIQKYKARLVVRGFTQQAGIDYEETFSPVARLEIVRIILALSADKEWTVYQFDVKSAFLNEELKEEVYEKYVIDTLEKFNMAGCKTACTPMNIGEKLQHEDGTEAADGTLYRSLIGRLIYLTHSRPDISFSVGLLSRFMHKPSKHHLRAAKRVLRYLAGTKDFGIWFQRTKDFKLKGYTDSDWAGSVEDRKSTSGSCFILGEAVVSWSSKKQATVALSSTEAEYVAANAAACQAVWMRRILSDMCSEQLGPTEIYCDNKSVVLLARNLGFYN